METGVDITDMEKSVGQIRAWGDNWMFSPQMYLQTLWCQSYLNIITELTYRVLNEVCHECDKNYFKKFELTVHIQLTHLFYMYTLWL